MSKEQTASSRGDFVLLQRKRGHQPLPAIQPSLFGQLTSLTKKRNKNFGDFLYALAAVLLLLAAGNAQAALVRPAQACDTLYVSNNVPHGGTTDTNTVNAFSFTGADLGEFAGLPSVARGLVFDPAGNLYAGRTDGTINKITPAGVVSTYATMPPGDGVFGLAFDSDLNLYASVWSTDRIYKITPAGVVSLFTDSQLQEPQALAFDSAGILYASNATTRRITKYDTGTGAYIGDFATTPNFPLGIAFDGAGNLYSVQRTNTGADYVRKYSPTGVDLGVFANIGMNNAIGTAFDSEGNLYVVNTSVPYSVTKYDATGAYLGVFASTGLNTPQYLAFGPGNCAPTADAGADQSIRAGDEVLLDGSASFDDNTASAALGYNWTFFSKPAGSAAILTDATTDMPNFVADVAGTYVLELVVTDEGGLESTVDQVEISSDNLAPTAVATVDFGLAIVGTPSNFDGSGSTDPEMDALTYAWAITDAPAGSTAALVGDDTATPTLNTDVEGAYELTLTVSDFIGAGTPATVDIVATTPANYAELKIVDACDAVESLSSSQVTSNGHRKAFCNFLKQATKDIQKGKIDKSIGKLNQALERTDGCASLGSPDGNGKGMDWITDCYAQMDIYDLLTQAKDALSN